MSVAWLHEQYKSGLYGFIIKRSQEMAADIFTKAFNNGARWREVLDLIGITIIDGTHGVEVEGGDKKARKGKGRKVLDCGADGEVRGMNHVISDGDGVVRCLDDDVMSDSRSPAFDACCALHNPLCATCAIRCFVAMAPRKYVKVGEEAKGSPKSAKAKASQAKSTPSVKGKLPSSSDPKAFPPPPWSPERDSSAPSPGSQIGGH